MKYAGIEFNSNVPCDEDYMSGVERADRGGLQSLATDRPVYEVY